ncbi:YbdD/YjiX family protein [Gordonia sp. CPCC 205515]|uniref:YbdD/YjiX family protein n=1 Tax=Gordonia sp. CPCC 205515 TaxID=3140791 RepID=UPI003AF3729E
MIATLRQGCSTVGWYVGSLMGDRDYDRYRAHQSTRHPGEPILSERDYWQSRYAAQDHNPGARCC